MWLALQRWRVLNEQAATFDYTGKFGRSVTLLAICKPLYAAFIGETDGISVSGLVAAKQSDVTMDSPDSAKIL